MKNILIFQWRNIETVISWREFPRIVGEISQHAGDFLRSVSGLDVQPVRFRTASSR
jgi:hypothetical protein